MQLSTLCHFKNEKHVLYSRKLEIGTRCQDDYDYIFGSFQVCLDEKCSKCYVHGRTLRLSAPRALCCSQRKQIADASAVMHMHFDHTCNQSLYSQPPVINNQDANFAMF